MFTSKTSLNTNKQKLKPQFYIKAYEFSYIEVDVDIRKNNLDYELRGFNLDCISLSLRDVIIDKLGDKHPPGQNDA